MRKVPFETLTQKQPLARARGLFLKVNVSLLVKRILLGNFAAKDPGSNSGKEKMKWKLLFTGAACALLAGCGKDSMEPAPETLAGSRFFTLEQVAELLAGVPIGPEQMEEVYDAAISSAGNGYDHEYLMESVFASPGAGIGDSPGTKSAKEYAKPLRELLREAVASTKAPGDGEAMLEALENSDVQIYWPYAEAWDKQARPVITFDPGNPWDDTSTGYTLSGEKVLVDEQMAMERPVWVVSNNSDASYTSLELMRRQDPDWGSGGGEIYIKPSAAVTSQMQTLVLKSFTSHRQFDNWFCGGSEFMVRIGSVENFNASTEAELRLYKPEVTEFMVVVKRSQKDEEIPFNVILVSEWTSKLQSCAFMITEDDGGTRTSWKWVSKVIIKNQSYGIDVDIPFNSRDDIVWRGSLTRKYIEKYSGQNCGYGDVEAVLELI